MDKKDYNSRKNLKVSFAKCPIQNRKKIFSESSCILPISVGQKISAHEGKKFLGTIELINKSFKCCTLLIDDTIQRHTMKISESISDEELRKKALSIGDEWLEKNRPIYSQLTIPYNILRWDYWFNHPTYHHQRTIINDFYSNNTVFKTAVDATITEYLSRYTKKLDIVASKTFNYETAFHCCLEYLLEECTAMCLWAEEQYDFEVYPTGRNDAMKITYDLIIKPRHRNVLISVSLHFRKVPIKHGDIYA